MKGAIPCDFSGPEAQAVGVPELGSDPFIETTYILNGLRQMKRSVGAICDDLHALPGGGTLEKIEVVLRQPGVEVPIRIDCHKVDEHPTLANRAKHLLEVPIL